MSSRIELLFADFIRTGLYLRNWSPRTVRTYKQAFSSFQQSLRSPGTAELTDMGASPMVTKAQLEAWIIWLRQKGVTPGGCNMYIRTINSFTSWLKEQGHASEEFRLKLLPCPRQPLRGFQDAEIRSLLSFRPVSVYELRTFTLTVLLLDTGCRIDEALTLHVENVDMDNLQLTVTGKGSKKRVVPFSLEFRKILFRYMQHRIKHIQGVSKFVFCSRSGSHLSYRNCYRDIKNLCAKAQVVGDHVHPHAMRHAFAVNYIRRGGDIYRLSRILGHSSISTTTLYLRSMGIEQIREGHISLLSR